MIWQQVKFNIEEAMKAQRGSRGIALLFNFGTRWGGGRGGVVKAMPWSLQCPFYRRLGGFQGCLDRY
jgi:hypothetical protein